MGLKNMIRCYLPESWEVTAKKNKSKDELVERLYRSIPKVYRGRYHYKEGIIYIKRIVKLDAGRLITALDKKPIGDKPFVLNKWEKIVEQIINFEESTK